MRAVATLSARDLRTAPWSRGASRLEGFAFRTAPSSVPIRRLSRSPISAFRLATVPIVGFLTAAVLRAQDAPVREPLGKVREVHVSTRDVFTEQEADGNLLYGFANLFHVTTKGEVVRRELWFGPGDEVDQDDIDELERNVRALELFGDVRTRAERVGDGQVDVFVDTRDRFTLGASASVAHVGGVNKLDMRLSETNLFGSGKGLSASAKYSDTGHVSTVSWSDPQFLGSWHTLDVQIGETDEGNFFAMQFARPFRHIEDPVSYGVDTDHSRNDFERYREGDTVVQVPIERHALHLFGAVGSGSRVERTAVGLDTRMWRHDYGTPDGSAVASERVPGDTTAFEFGPYATFDYRPRFLTVTRLDTLDYRQDIGLGAGAYGRLAARYRDEEGAGAQLQPLIDVRLRTAAESLPETFLTFEAATDARFGSTGREELHARLALHAFQMSLPAQTLAASLTWESVEELQDLAPQLTLGEDNGLRGYPAREFDGTRVARLNLEDRIDTGAELWTFRLGLAAFCDVGWVHDPLGRLSFADPLVSAGFGLRIGSSNLLGGRVLRLDVAFPLSTVDGEDYGVSVSFATGQVFTFFGNAEELGGL